ncbi:MAG: IS5 family transposase [Phycisphaerales bacterium]|nr:IS5 family transposase [Phycisphaerales bacterium]
MRGRVDSQGDIYHTFNVHDLVPARHPLREIKRRVDQVLAGMSRDFNAAYGRTGRPSIPPERLIKALLLQALYSVRSDIQLCEQIGYNLLFRWFLDMQPSEQVWTPEVFSMNRQRFADHGFVQTFFDRIVREALLEGVASREHFAVDGTLIQSYASLKSVRPIQQQDEKVSDGSDDDDPGNPTVNFRGQKRANATHRSVVDPEARLARKGDGQPALLSHSVHVLMETDAGLCLDVAVDEANGRAEREQALTMVQRLKRRHPIRPASLAADKGYAAGPFLAELERQRVTPLVPMPNVPIKGDDAPAAARRRARQRMTTAAYRAGQRVRKRVEEIIGWCKTIGGLRRTRFVGRWKIRLQALTTGAAYNLLRLARLRPSPA